MGVVRSGAGWLASIVNSSHAGLPAIRKTYWFSAEWLVSSTLVDKRMLALSRPG
jgi:hypothetical protein